MPVRCPGCDATVSEWAARCPSCHADVSGAPVIAEAAGNLAPRGPDELEESAPPGKRRHGHRRLAIIASALLVAGLVGLGIVRYAPMTTASPPGGRLAGVAGLPPDLAATPVVYVSAGQLATTTLGGSRPGQIGVIAGQAQPANRSEPEGRSVVFLAAGATGEQAEEIGPSGTITGLGRATGVLPGPPGQVGLVLEDDDVAAGPPPYTLRVAGGPPSSSPPLAIPAGTSPVAILSAGRVALRSDQTGDLLIWSPPRAPTTDLGPSVGIVGVSNTVLAWLSSRDCATATACPLHLFDLARGTDHLVQPVPGSHGFAPGGAFSPDGTRLLAFVVPSGVSSGPAQLETVIVDPATGRSTPIARPTPTLLVPGLPAGNAWWTPDGSWLVFGGVDDRLFAYPIDSTVRCQLSRAVITPGPEAAGVVGVCAALTASWELRRSEGVEGRGHQDANTAPDGGLVHVEVAPMQIRCTGGAGAAHAEASQYPRNPIENPGEVLGAHALLNIANTFRSEYGARRGAEARPRQSHH